MTEMEPFIVRGHHALRLHQILAGGVAVQEMVEKLHSNTTTSVTSPFYQLDVYGFTNSQTETVKTRMTVFFEDFLALPGDAPVRFVADQPDGICGSCFIGRHCNRDQDDQRWLDGIRDLAPEGTATNGPKQLQLPAWAARQVLADESFQVYMFPSIDPRIDNPHYRITYR